MVKIDRSYEAKFIAFDVEYNALRRNNARRPILLFQFR